jgi:hypothetical protein
VIKFVSDLRQVCGFSPSTAVSPINKTDRHDITEILVYSTITNLKSGIIFFLNKNGKGKESH